MKRSISFLTFLLVALPVAFPQQYGWKDLSDNIPIEGDLTDVYFTSEDEGWITTAFELELFLGMSQTDTATSNWRGTHAPKLKSMRGWGSTLSDSANGNNSSGFNAFPAGYCAPDNWVAVFEGLGRSVGFWSSVKQGVSWQRWLSAPSEGS